MGDMYLLIYASSAVAAAVFRARGDELAGWVPGLRWIAPLSFVAATEFVYWSGWHDLRIALPLVLIGVPLFFVLWPAQRDRPLRAELASGAWIVCYLVALTVLSGLGSFGGANRLPAPYDSLVVAVLGLGVFWWAVRAGRAREQSPTR
jgi:amino acid transporter